MGISIRWFLLMSVLSFSFKESDIIEIRKAYHLAIYDAKLAEDFCKKLSTVQNPNAIQKGYLGAGKMILAKFAFSPISKFQLFSEGKNLLESAINLAPNDLELRYLRYAIQLNCPAFLNYNSQKTQDRSFILKKMPELKDKDLKNRILTFLAASANLTTEEREALQ